MQNVSADNHASGIPTLVAGQVVCNISSDWMLDKRPEPIKQREP